MNQSIYLLNTDFFENPESGSELVIDQIKQNCRTEKLIMIFDPMMFPYFSATAKVNNNLLEKVVKDYYRKFEEQTKNQLFWYELDEQCNFYISIIGSLLLDLDYKTREIQAIGLIPITFKHGNVYLYFAICPYDVEDQFNMIGFDVYDKNSKSVMTQLLKKGISINEK